MQKQRKAPSAPHPPPGAPRYPVRFALSPPKRKFPQTWTKATLGHGIHRGRVGHCGRTTCHDGMMRATGHCVVILAQKRICSAPGGAHQGGRPVQILDPDRVRNFLGVWRGGGRWVGRSADGVPRGGSRGTPTHIPQNDPHDALIILNTHKWGKKFYCLRQGTSKRGEVREAQILHKQVVPQTPWNPPPQHPNRVKNTLGGAKTCFT